MKSISTRSNLASFSNVTEMLTLSLTQYLHIQKSKLISNVNHVKYYNLFSDEAEKYVIFMFIAVALRQARRDRQLVSRRLLPSEDEDQPEVTMDTTSVEQVGYCDG